MQRKLIEEKNTHRVLVIGLDGATFDVLDPWLEDGTLPTLSKMRNKGVYGRLLSTIPPLTAPAWTSFMTGKNPGKHGVLNFFSDISSEGEKLGGQFTPVNSTSIQSEVLWEILSRQGYRTGVVNVPLTYPPQPVNGFIISGMLTPLGANDFTYPRELAFSLDDYQIDLDYFLGDEMGHHEYLPHLEQLINELRNLLEIRAKTVKELLTREKSDFFMVVFTGTDRLGHFLWPYHFTPKGPSTDNSNVVLYNAVRGYYRRLDSLIKELIDVAGSDVTVIIMSDHGMGSAPDKVVYLNQWLHSEDLLRMLPWSSGWKNPNSWLTALGLSRDRLVRLKNLVPTSRFLQNKITSAARLEIPIDHFNSKAYFRTIYMSVGGIYIEPRIRQDHQAYEGLCNQIIERIEQIQDPETGEGVIDLISRGSEIYLGDSLKNAPDIVVVLKSRYRSNHRLGSNAIIKSRIETRHAERVLGDHRPEGIFIASGPGVCQTSDAFTGLKIEDLAPTILYLLGAEIPESMDGQIIRNAIETSLLKKKPPRYVKDVDVKMTSQHVDLTSEQEESIKNRLRALGYID